MGLTQPERIERIQALGYTDREAAFLVTAALHSGCFVVRQFMEATGAKKGKATDEFTAKAIAARHVCPHPTLNRTILYQIAKPIFVALEDPDNRNRRIKQPYLSRLRLMALDFVLSYPANRYLSTEEEKLAYFAERFQLPPEVYPCATYHSARSANRTTTRYFIEKYPVYEAPGGAAFTYLDENSLASFGTFLDRYQSLLSALPAAILVYVTTSAKILEAARTCFTGRWRKPLVPIDYAALEGAFQTRAGLERTPLEELTQADLNALRVLRSARWASLFGDWQAYGMEAIRTRYERNVAGPVPTFTPCIVPVEYSFL